MPLPARTSSFRRAASIVLSSVINNNRSPSSSLSSYQCNNSLKGCSQLVGSSSNVRFYKYNYSQISAEEIRRLSEESYSNGRLPWVTGLLGVLAGFGLGYLLAETTEEPKLKEAGIEKVAKGSSKNIVELFEQYADVDIVDPKTGRTEKMMSLEAFINSLLTSRPDAPSWVALPRRDGKLLVDKKRANDEQLKLIFDYADTDKNGYISFDEYALFMTFLSCSERQLQIAFQCFDLDGSGSIEASEFKELIKASRLRKSSKKDILDDIDWNNNGLMNRLFGKDLSQKLSFEEFNKFIHKCKSALLKQEFLQYDVEGNGLISVEAFSELMTKSVHYNSTNISDFKRQLNLLKTRGFFAPTGRIDYDTFKAFNDMASHSEDIGIAIQLITSSRGGMKKQDFKFALERVAKIKVNDRVVDLVYAIYDKDKDGVLEYDEFMSTMKARKEKM
ncbi:predicted protein [Naegleria gruberi]|uniref:Predicted protein n=1 Tax=Naegleria gruberi TaxID=5762 RepID=D2VB88_NAEGR|nr:uncharacterized protein NAEGRDRAFT_66130 [Naegleria gruberi]EFC45753.1 predicted protein [Naegleria gruberi]|eukprot:XP_002678497.1 predicted protein [Naegleria gruberi strain NEG-M]